VNTFFKSSGVSFGLVFGLGLTALTACGSPEEITPGIGVLPSTEEAMPNELLVGVTPGKVGEPALEAKIACIAPGFLDTKLAYAARRRVTLSRAADGLTKPSFSTSHSAL
jgi:hypothetical protein